MSAKSSKDRGVKSRTILLEGKRLVSDAIAAGAVIKSIFFTRIELLDGLPVNELKEQFESRFYKVKSRHMRVWSDMAAPPGIMC